MIIDGATPDQCIIARPDGTALFCGAGGVIEVPFGAAGDLVELLEDALEYISKTSYPFEVQKVGDTSATYILTSDGSSDGVGFGPKVGTGRLIVRFMAQTVVIGIDAAKFAAHRNRLRAANTEA